ncbi:MAG: OmpA family protein [Betaproteobacteria bacterium HGW-Betaproteobacteria-6]|jgi:outer membrane protein OmpA-like peptidoglycan-associated protein|nr:MAG: OmpA family protein [Betaproteobacteria bacterium HGW-Betaproteobacteria-6]
MKTTLSNCRRLGLIGCSAVLAASCSLFHNSAPQDHSKNTGEAARGQLAQLDFGRQAVFGHCAPPACPSRTPKTLATDSSVRTVDRAAPTPPAQSIPAESVTEFPASKIANAQTITVQFGLGSAKLSTAARSSLNEAMSTLLSARQITIVGRTDNTGPLAFNESLALARALAVRDHLLSKHPRLTPALTIKARGACCFIAANDTLAGRTQNRRVELVFDLRDKAQP